MLSDSLDPDQDLQSGSKVFTWYDVCCNIGGGGISSGGDYVLVVKFSGGYYVLIVKFSGGDYVLVVKFMGGGFCPHIQNEQGVFCPGGIMSVSLFTVFLKNRNFISKIRRSKVTDYAALKAPCIS